MAKMTIDEALNILQGDKFDYEDSVIEEAISVAEENGHDEIVRSFNQRRNTSENIENDPQDFIDRSDELSLESERYKYDNFLSEVENHDIAEVINNTEITDTDAKGKQVVLDEDKKKSYLSLLFEGAKLKAETYLSSNKEFSEKSEVERQKAFKDEVRAVFFTDFSRVAISSEMDKPKSKERVIGSPEYRNYVHRQAKKAQKVFEGILNNKSKVTLKVDNILSSVADTAINVENYVNNLKNIAVQKSKKIGEKLNNVAGKISLKVKKLETLANYVSENRYEIWKSVKKTAKASFHDNKIKLFGNVGASAAFGYAATAAVASGGSLAIPVAAYAAYHAAGSWVYPVVAEYRKINRQKAEKGEKKAGFMATMKQAWKNRIADKEDGSWSRQKKQYVINGTVNTVLAMAGAAWLPKVLETGNTVKDVVEAGMEGAQTVGETVAAAKAGVSLGRAVTTSAAQVTEAGVAYLAAAKDPESIEKKEEFKQVALAAGIGLIANSVAQYFALDHGGNEADSLADSANPENTPLPEEAQIHTDSSKIIYTFDNHRLSEEAQIHTDTTATDTVAAENITPADGAETEGLTASEAVAEGADVSTVTVPTEYSEDMGITERQYNTMMNTMEGTLKRVSGEEITLNQAYANLTDEVMEKNFPGKTREQVLYSFMQLSGFSRKAVSVGTDPETGLSIFRETPAGAEYLESKFEKLNFDKDQMDSLVAFAEDNTYADSKTLMNGLKEMFPDADKKTLNSMLTIIHSNRRFAQHGEEYEAMLKLLACGQALDDDKAAALNTLMDEKGQVLSGGAKNVRLTGLRADCGEEANYEWRGMHTRTVETPVEPAASVEPTAPVEPEGPEEPVTPAEPVAEDDTVVIREGVGVFKDIRTGNPTEYEVQYPGEASATVSEPEAPAVQEDELIIREGVGKVEDISNGHGTDYERQYSRSGNNQKGNVFKQMFSRKKGKTL